MEPLPERGNARIIRACMDDTTSIARIGSPALPPVPADAALLLMVLIWGVNFAVAKDALAELPPLVFNELRFPFAALVVYGALRMRGRIPRPDRADLGRVIFLGILGNVFYQQFFIFGLANTRAGIASVLLAGTPIATTLLSSVAGHERIRARIWAGIIASFVGIVLVVANGGAGRPGENSLLGNLLMIGATVSWALYTVGSRPLIERYGSIAVTAWTLWIGTVGICMIGLPATLRFGVGDIGFGTWLAVLYAGALSIGLAYLIWYHGVRALGNTRTAAYSNLTPVVALIVAWLLLDEVPAVGQLVGAAVIIAGVWLVQLATRGSIAAPSEPR
jgi:drug/metabolite transporter (DMT)-like permease